MEFQRYDEDYLPAEGDGNELEYRLTIDDSEMGVIRDRITTELINREKAHAGILTNFEVLAFLQSRGASKDPTRVIAPIAPSEFKVYDYLVQSAACNQTRENIDEFLEKCKKYDLAKAEILNIINIRPASAVEIYPIIEECDTRMGERFEELIEMVVQVLPPPPTEMKPEEGIDEDKEENRNGEQIEAS